MADVLSIVVNILLAILVAVMIERGMQNQRVEKDFFISELNEAQQSFSDLERMCSRNNSLSLQLTVYEVEKAKKNLVRMWNNMGEQEGNFHKKHNDEFLTLIQNIKTLNTQFSDSNYYKDKTGYKPITIKRNHIYLNNTVKQEIGRTFSIIKDAIFQLKIAINNI
ncbi:MAG: hypothetical protein J5490_05150 [Bacteroidales bacterium]|nr:hypothetical protein [Bacteroidales bacterium]